MIDLSLRYDTLADAKYALGVLENAAGSKSKTYGTHTSGAREVVDSLNMLIGISASIRVAFERLNRERAQAGSDIPTKA